ncbi:two-component system cell cycle response regulator [Sulfitobacter undariae]|uniref:diguanylate cyclase n=1 Tax=Sulfitobacter undariae TaxID=1563671 RepID=A0A7W6E1C9_9RHOB|nr:diguanylate cyclase [Sulfitobacter undariae]MBB3992932.1 two-component system cell cycle response regulator [Sulfitobacter undariae]
MQGKILIIDGISTNRIVLKVKLIAAFYQVIMASSIAEALQTIQNGMPDLIISAVNLPDGTAAQLCKRLRSTPQTSSLPVLTIASSPDQQIRLETLRSGAFDVMNKPINETFLLSRVRNTIRAHNELSDWDTPDAPNCALGLAEAPAKFVRPGKVCLVGADTAPLQRWLRELLPHWRAQYTVTQLTHTLAQVHVRGPNATVPDAVVLELPQTKASAASCLRLISALRASPSTRDIALIIIQKTPDPLYAAEALDMGADDVMSAGFDAPELALRLEFLLRRKQQLAKVMQNVRSGLREVLHDPLTGLYNRRHAMPFIAQEIERSATSSAPLALILADMDHFKQVNDLFGHTSGDAVLVETARRLERVLRSTDVLARIGGEEFVIAMPATDTSTARIVAHRVCDAISNAPFQIPGSQDPINITISVGLAMAGQSVRPEARELETVESLLTRADNALYAAKVQGRNRVNLNLQEPHHLV